MRRSTVRLYRLLPPSVLFISPTFMGCEPAAETGADRAQEFKKVEIRGSVRFRKQVTEALELLMEKTPGAYAIVTEYVGLIEQGKHSGLWAYRKPPTYEMADPTTFYSVTWCAGSIAPDSFHAKLYHHYKKTHVGAVPDKIWVGQDAERRCLKHQLEVLQKIGAPKHEIDHCSKQDGTYHDVNKNGGYHWDDYDNRDW